ncbi:GIY-YIG nuclease family protein [Aliarcobacter cryaerophilus]|uniref:GIY-YIG nuclease family protein n=1 Tax=Aliarcobacter cryaerophilus TaxID=28198 RepID=A0AA46S0H1_9BACT|nr:GIY-YIG nuclease family protein [Aliarcobacter cryaerophilus]UYF42724.1 GIY-YIG nuclease family protein [Aliarcobacter cryaerophilus]
MADINSLDDIFNSDEFGLLNTQNEVDIHTLKNVPKVEKRADADFVARREKFDDFDKYEQLFIDCQEDLRTNRREIVPSIESQLDIGTFCVLDGVLLYIADIQDGYRGNSGKINRRTTIIFENGTKSNMLLRSLGKRLKDSGNMVTKLESEKDNHLFDVTNEDTQNGYIYILKSLSKKDEIITKKNLYKIGFSTNSVELRIKNAKEDPTYLMADVKTVSAYEVYNVNPHKLEQLIHKFFGNSCLDIEIYDANGKLCKPKEWFIAPLEVIEEAIELIISGEIINYKYDEFNERIIER